VYSSVGVRWQACVGRHNPRYDGIFILATLLHLLHPDDCFFQVSKIIGAASEANSSFNKLGQAISAAIEAMAHTLDHCHIPNCFEYSIIPPKQSSLV